MGAIFKYIISRSLRRNIFYFFCAVFILFITALLYIRIYTQHGRTLTVPYLSDLTLSEAIDVVESKNLRYVVFDSTYVANKAPGVIIDQHPKPASLVKKGRKIYFTINASGPEKIKIPNLIGVTLREGRSRLLSYGLQLGNLAYRYDISTNVILEARLNGIVLEPGDSVSKGMAIDLVLSKGLGHTKTTVPNLLGLTEEQAKVKLSNAMFGLGVAMPDNTVDLSDSIPPRIFRQKPVSDPEIKIPLGSTITVFVTSDSTKLPGYEDDQEEELKFKEYYEDEPDNSDYNNIN
jgi:beta-lactam-binding protein with PASTA domain